VTLLELLAVCAATPGVAYSLWVVYAFTRTHRAVRPLGVPSETGERHPVVSLIIAARDEEADLEASLRQRLADPDPDLEFVLVNDRSRDRTGELMDALAREDPRVKVVHLDALPAGWLGKVHAMQRGLEVSTGPWLLFTDADIHFRVGTVRLALEAAQRGGHDHITVLPVFERTTPGLDLLYGPFLRWLVVFGRLWKVPDPSSRAAVGGGLFNFMSRAALERTRGLPWLKLEVGDDVALGQLLKRAGARPGVFDATGLVSLQMYPSVRAMGRGMEKAALPILGRFRLSLLAATVGVLCLTEVAPFLLALLGPGAPARTLAGIASGFLLLSAVLEARWCHRPLLPTLLVPVGTTVMAVMTLRAGWSTWRRGSITWRDTEYSLKELRAGQRLELF
jgi:glycosyltransferase involved in cell wall biosynthesis